MNEPECMVGGVIYNGVKVGFSNLDFTGSGYKKYMIGACDYLEANLYGIRAAMCGGGGDDGRRCGTYLLHVNNMSGYVFWSVGAWNCDYFWRIPSGLRYAFCGGRCGSGVNCGWSYLHVNDEPTYTSWTIGACLSYV